MMEEQVVKLKDGRYFLDEEQNKIYSYIVDKQPEFSNQYSYTEMSMADLFADCYRHNTIYCPEMKSWYIYDGTIWVQDTGAITTQDRLKEFIKLLVIYSKQLSSNDDFDLETYQKFVKSLVDRRARERILKDAQTEACISYEKFDSNPNLINCLNGTFDLEKNEFHFHRYNDYLTMKTNCDYILPNMNYKCDRWYSFVEQIMQNDTQKLEYLQRALGYSLLGKGNEECMFIAYGKTTRNGKGTFFNSIEHALGDYQSVASSRLICNGNNKDVNAAQPALCGLKGKRIVTMSETDESVTIDRESFKRYTGGDTIQARPLFGTPFYFIFQGVFWLMCNNLPMITDKGIFGSDRIRVIEFNRHFDKDERDTSLKSLFSTREAASIIFMWLLQGVLNYKNIGLKEPDVVNSAIKDYEYHCDPVEMFVDDMCEKGDFKTLRTVMYESFESWRKKLDYPVMSKQRFYANMDATFESCKSNGYLYYRGVKLK